MEKLCILTGMTILGCLGWWIGCRAGFFTGFLVSGVGSILGVYVGWRIHRDYLG